MASTLPPDDHMTHAVDTAGGRIPIGIGAALAVAVAVVHVIDQGGLTGLKDPAYLGYGYRVLELAALGCAVLLFTRARAAGWVLALGVSVGPLVGIILSRSVGLPDATDDIGNWSEPLGVLAMICETALLVLTVTVLARRSRRGSPAGRRVTTTS